MAGKFYGVVGFIQTEVNEYGVAKEIPVERKYYGNVVDSYSVNVISADKVNPDLSLGNEISIIADEYANEHFSAIRFVEWAGAVWHVTSVRAQRPRLILRLGGVYSGARATEEPETP